MNKQAKKALAYLPLAIDAHNNNMVWAYHYYEIDPNDLIEKKGYKRGYGWCTDKSSPGNIDVSMSDFRKDLLHLLFHYYRGKNLITLEQCRSLISQVQSPDRENWLVAFMIIDNLNSDNDTT